MMTNPLPSPTISRRRFIAATATSVGVLAVSHRPAGAFLKQGEPKLLYHTQIPPNAEPPVDMLVQSWITPTELFYIRSHAATPKLNAETFRLSVEGLVDKPFSVTTAELRDRFKNYSTTATLTCAGNRREEHSLVKPVSGVPWQAGAIGNATWDGAKLADLLKLAGVQVGAKHVWFEGVDQIEHDADIIPFGASIPLDVAMNDSRIEPQALVAYEMNGKPLLPDHGFPLRAVVPGVIGARSVKWLGKIIVSDRPSPNHYVATAYKLVTDGTDDEWAATPPLHNFVMNSVLCQPARTARLKVGQHVVSGYALPPGFADHRVKKVELSTDGGASWTAAQFTSPDQPLCWRLWNAQVTITADTREIIVRATDSQNNVQPRTVAWNLKGYNFNAWHHTPVEIQP